MSSIPPSSLFGGKLLGVGAAGLTQFLVWALCMAAGGPLRGGGARAACCPRSRPCCSARSWSYFLLGYFLYAALYAAVGSAVNTPAGGAEPGLPGHDAARRRACCSSAWSWAARTAGSRWCSRCIPFLTPLLMFLRITVLTPPAWQIALSVVLMLGGDRGAHLAGRPRLPRGHPHVRQAPDVPGDRALGPRGLASANTEARRGSNGAQVDPRIAAEGEARRGLAERAGRAGCRCGTARRRARAPERAPCPTTGRPSGVPGPQPRPALRDGHVRQRGQRSRARWRAPPAPLRR